MAANRGNREILDQFQEMLDRMAGAAGAAPNQQPQRQREANPVMYRRRVIVIPSPGQSAVPRGRFRHALRAQNLERTMDFRVGMAADEIVSTIRSHFQAFGHMELRFVFTVFIGIFSIFKFTSLHTKSYHGNYHSHHRRL